MIQTTLTCGKCGSTALRKNGSSKGKAQYRCTACRHQAVFAPAAPARAARYAQVEKLLLERVSQRAIVRLTGVARMTVARLAKKPGRNRVAARFRVGGRNWNWTNCGRSWAASGVRSGSGWRWSGLRATARRL